MAENAKVKNAKKVSYDGFEFRSGLEVFIYKTLKSEGIEFLYEGIAYEIIPSLEFNSMIGYWPNASGKDTKTLKLRYKSQRKTYTPDFTFDWMNKKYFIVIEAKGWADADYPTKKKLFSKLIEDGLVSSSIVIFMEPHTQRHVKECIEFIKNLE